MSKFKLGLVASIGMAFAVSSASASIPRHAAAPAIQRATTPPMVQTASFAESCDDPNYKWYEYSGWEAIGCLISGQWP